MRRQLLPALLVLLTMTVLLGVAYPLVVTGVAQLAFTRQADGSLVEIDGTPVASELIGQPFDGPEWFEPRPSSAGEGYDATSSSGSNLGPTNPELIDAVRERVDAYRARNGLPAEVAVPIDAVTGSASGLDPHISVANARLQAPRVAEARGLSVDQVLDLIDDNTDERPLGVLGDPGVNVVLLNLAVDEAGGRP
ncbi:MAG: K(+)-transporting ATPase subunit C [Acidimicrobiales bacterium]|jgi:K+-transporting ATPase ATPase C chain|nr:K(+)-transporting ATPase subunit C [Acidimicrobiales bacterium]